MILTEIQHYLANHRQASLAELANHFHIEADALRGMLNQLVKKGRVNKQDPKKCGGCHSCNSDTLELYFWVGKSS